MKTISVVLAINQSQNQPFKLRYEVMKRIRHKRHNIQFLTP